MLSNHFILCHPLLLLPSIFPSIRVFSNQSVLLIRWPKYWSFSLSISPSKKYSGLISFRIDGFDLAVQGTLKNLLQHYSSKTSVLWHSAFFIVQLSHPYMTTGKTIELEKTLILGKIEGRRRRRRQRVRWLDGITDSMDMGFGWSLGVGDGQGGLAFCSSWGHKESDTTERLN